jgi:hypothetical protein
MQSTTVNLVQPPLYRAFVASTAPPAIYMNARQLCANGVVLDGMILKPEVRRWQSATSGRERK